MAFVVGAAYGAYKVGKKLNRKRKALKKCKGKKGKALRKCRIKAARA